MKSIHSRLHLLVLFVALFFDSNRSDAATLSGTYTLPGIINGTTVNNLTDLATLLNGGANPVSGTVVFEFTSSYTSTTETYPVTFNAFSGTGNVIIRPALSVSSALVTTGVPSATALINLNGVRNFTFDGRAGGAGNSLLWQIQNTAASGSYPAIQLMNGATYDTLEYVTVLSSGTSSTATILISTSTVSGGNSYDVVSNCNIGNYSGYPYNPVLSNGTAGVYANSNNSILNNNIYNFQTYNTNSPYYAGINIAPTGNGSNWTISGNSIYSTINALSLGSYPYHAIYFNAGVNSTGNVISGNYIGGQQAHCGGAPWQVPAYQANGYADFDGIAVAAGASVVSNNTIQNIFMASRYGSSTFRGINILSGTATVTGNIIGGANDSIVSGLYGTMMGIQNQSTQAVTISNNTISNFISDGRSYVSGTSSTTTGVSIGIYGYSSSAVLGANTIINNSIYNFSRVDNYNNNLYFPVGISAGSQVAGQNIIYQMNTIAGICVQTTGSGLQTVSKNVIYNLHNNLTGGSSKTYINGIVDLAGSGGSIVNANLIYGFYAPNTYGASGSFYGLNGIYLPLSANAGTNLITNNMVDLGYRYSDGSSVQNALITGIWDNSTYTGTTLKIKCIHNSVYIGGTNTNAFSNNLNSYAFRRVLDYGSSVYDSLVVFNNIFVNKRSNTAGTAINYGTYFNSTLDVAADYNDIYGGGIGFELSDVAGTDYATLAAFQSAITAFEAHSLSTDPLFVSPTTVMPNLHVQTGTPVDAQGSNAITLVYDFDSLVRANYSPVDIGAAINCSSSTPVAVSLAVSQDTVCVGTSVTFTATPTNGGAGPVYAFYKNSALVQSGGSNTYVVSNPANNDSVKVAITSNAACVSPDTASSNSIILSVTNNTITPSVSINPSQNNFCHGATVTFTATAVNGGASPTYNFYLNNVSVQNGAGNTYVNFNLNNTDSLWVVLTSNASCLTTSSATSAKVHMVVNGVVIPAVTLAASQNNICAGTQVIFTASSSNGGTSPLFKFYKNGNLLQTGSGNTYTGNNLNNNDSIWVVVISNAPCAAPDSVISNKVRMLVNAVVVPSINISTASSNICSNASTVFNSSITNGGSAPVYAWRKNGTNVASGTTYSTNTLVSGDVITCVLTSNANCALPDTALSNVISMTVSGTVTPSVSINPSTLQMVCAGTSVSYHAMAVNGGSAPTYVWKKNGLITGNNSATYNDVAPQNNDIIECVITSNSTCASPATATSNTDTILVHPAASYTYSQQICQGDSIFFADRELKSSGTFSDSLNTVYGCDSVVHLQLTVLPAFTSTQNANVCFGNTYIFNGHSLSAAGIYADTLTSVSGCDSIIVINLTVAPLISTFDSAAICSGDSYSFNGRQLTVAGLYYDTLTTQLGCDSAVTLSLIVHPRPVPVITLQGEDSLSSTGFVSYQWLVNDQAIAAATSAGYVATQNGAYAVAVVDSNGCNDTSNVQQVVHVSLLDLKGQYFIQLFPNPSSGKLNVSVTGMSGLALSISVADVYGNQVYKLTTELANGKYSGIMALEQLAAGMYIMQFITDQNSVTRSFELVK